MFFPSSYRRAVKYGQRDPASEILRTEVLAALNSVQSSECGVQRYDYSQDVASVVPDGNHTSSLITNRSSLYIVSFPEAVAELVVSRKRLDSRTLSLAKDTTVDVMEVMRTLREFGFHEVEYVYEPGQFALRGSILDVYSYSCEYPYRWRRSSRAIAATRCG